eukprot:m.1471368 g.1471368  ORF g.1471368 m.1471368 type:complete len:362 (-) comp25146_c0_seq10:1254-2339(-)
MLARHALRLPSSASWCTVHATCRSATAPFTSAIRVSRAASTRDTFPGARSATILTNGATATAHASWNVLAHPNTSDVGSAPPTGTALPHRCISAAAVRTAVPAVSNATSAAAYCGGCLPSDDAAHAPAPASVSSDRAARHATKSRRSRCFCALVCSYINAASRSLSCNADKYRLCSLAPARSLRSNSFTFPVLSPGSQRRRCQHVSCYASVLAPHQGKTGISQGKAHAIHQRQGSQKLSHTHTPLVHNLLLHCVQLLCIHRIPLCGNEFLHSVVVIADKLGCKGLVSPRQRLSVAHEEHLVFLLQLRQHGLQEIRITSRQRLHRNRRGILMQCHQLLGGYRQLVLRGGEECVHLATVVQCD